MLQRIHQQLVLIATTAVLIAGLSGCGFALRGNVTLPAELDSVLVTGSDREMTGLLEDSLENSGSTIVDSEENASAVLDLIESEFTRDVRTTDSNGRATSYTLKYKVDYDVRKSNGEEIQINQSLTQLRVLQYDPLQELQSEEEAEFLQEEMQEEIVLQILRRLSRI
ncbi:MAG: hypothetical protein KTR18_04165 [Acidiferrobacterales bacterium]|nr:hypothetical protein [Acidiferrobacterales bacterium]